MNITYQITMITYYMQADFNNARDLIQAKTYELIIFRILKSTLFHDEDFRYVEVQSHGESDYCLINKRTKQKEHYDAKLLFDEELGYLLSKNSISSYMDWVKQINDELGEIGFEIMNNNYDVSDARLYNVLDKRMKSISAQENVILFFPFPLVSDMNISVYGQFASNELTLLFHLWIQNNPKYGNKKVLAIYPALGDRVIIRQLHNDSLMYFDTDEISRYIRYTDTTFE